MTKPMHLVIAGTPLEASLLTAWFRNSYTTEDLNITLVTEASSVRQRVHQLNYKNLGVISHLGLDEKAFMKLTAATFNLGTWHKGWLDNSHHYFQPFGTHGGSMDFVSFQHYLFKRRGIDTDISYEDYSLSCVAAYKGKFTHPKSDQNSIASTIGYSLAIDEQVTVRGLLDYFSNVEVTYHDASVSSVSVSDGVINALELSDGSQLSADIYLDCTGTERLLIKELSDYVFHPWSELGSYNRTDFTINATDDLPPYSEIIKTKSGWLRLDRSQTTTAGQFYSKSQNSTDEVINELSEVLNGAEVSLGMSEEVQSGRLESLWLGNCIAIGETAACFEALDCSPIHSLIAQTFRLLDLFPRSEDIALQRFEFNRKAIWWHDNIRDFNVLRHAMLNKRQTLSELISSELPESLKHKLSLYQSNGQMADSEEEPFHDDYLTSTLIGLELFPQKYNPLLESFDMNELNTRFNSMRDKISLASDIMPVHQDYLQRYLSVN